MKHPKKAVQMALKKQEELDQEAADRLHPLYIKRYVNEACLKLYNDDLYPESVRKKFIGFLITPDEAHSIFVSYKELILKFKNNPEQFLSSFNNISQDADTINVLNHRLDGISYNLILLELSAMFLKHLVNKGNSSSSQEIEKPIPQNQLAGLQYLAGHVVHKTYTQLRKKKNWKDFQQSIDILRNFKVDPDESHKLVSSKDRGGLWYICKEGISLFLSAEILFRKTTKNFVTSIDYPALLGILVKDFDVKSNFEKILSDNDCAKSEYAKNLLEKILGLYLRIRCHSYAKDIKEKQKIVRKTAGKKRSLRTELKQIEKKLDEEINQN